MCGDGRRCPAPARRPVDGRCGFERPVAAARHPLPPPPPPAMTNKFISICGLTPPLPNPLPDAAPIVDNKGINISSYANCVCAANTVKVASAVLNTVYEYTSTLLAFPAEGAEPPCHSGVTAEPST